MKAFYFSEVEYNEEIHDFCLIGEPQKVFGAGTLKEARKRMVENWNNEEAYSFRDHGEIKVVFNQTIEGYGRIQNLLYRIEY